MHARAVAWAEKAPRADGSSRLLLLLIYMRDRYCGMCMRAGVGPARFEGKTAQLISMHQSMLASLALNDLSHTMNTLYETIGI